MQSNDPDKVEKVINKIEESSCSELKPDSSMMVSSSFSEKDFNHLPIQDNPDIRKSINANNRGLKRTSKTEENTYQLTRKSIIKPNDEIPSHQVTFDCISPRKIY